MSLNENTKCDLSAGLAKIDFTTLITQVERRFYSLIGKARKQTENIQNNNLTKEIRKDNLSKMVSYGSKDLLQTSKDIVEVSELLHSLYNSTDREIEIVNK